MMATTSVDDTIREVERLYRGITGTHAPALSDDPYAPIPPECDPEQYIGEQVERLMASLAHDRPAAVRVGWTPAMSIWEGEGEVLCAVDLPGVARDAVDISISAGLLVVRGKSSPPGGLETLAPRYQERAFGHFERTIPLPPGVKLDQVRAQLRDGVLEVRLERVVQSETSQTIRVE